MKDSLATEAGDLRWVSKRQAHELVRIGTWDLETFNRWCCHLQDAAQPPEPGVSLSERLRDRILLLESLLTDNREYYWANHAPNAPTKEVKP